MSHKNIILIIVAIAILVFGGGGIFLYAHNTISSQNTNISPTPPEQQVLTLTPDDIGLTLRSTTYTKGASSGPAMHMEITKVSDITSVDCEIHYSHATDDGGRIQEGILCNLDVKPGQPISQDFPFATCSDVCHFQKDIQDIQAIIKVTKTDGKVYQVTDSMNL